MGWPQFDDAIGETDPDNPIVGGVLDAGGIVKNSISGKTDYYVVGESQIDGSRNKNYVAQKEKGKPIVAISVNNLKQLLGINDNDEQPLVFIELFDPVDEDAISTKIDDVMIGDIEINGDACSDWEYAMVGSQIDEPEELLLIDYLGDEEDITIPSRINGEAVHLNYSSKFEKCRAKTVRIPGGFKVLPNGLFKKNISIRELYVGYGVEEIESDFCLFASNLQTVSFPSTIKKVGKLVLYGTAWSEQQGNEVIAGNVLLNKYASEDWGESDCTYVVPDGVSCIAEWAFFTVYEGQKKAPYYITRIELPGSVKYISEEAFAHIGIGTIKIPSTIKYIGPRAFLGTGVVRNYESLLKEPFLIIGNLLHEILSYSDVVSIPDGVRIIGEGNMTLNTNSYIMNELVMPDSVEEIGKLAFSDCRGLEKIRFSNRLSTIGAHCFSGCKNLKSISLPTSVETIGLGAFSACGLTAVSVPGLVKSIDEYSFDKCKELVEVTLCEGVEEICNHAFRDCEALTTVTLPSTLKKIGYRAFENCKSLKEINIPSSVEFVAENAFDN